MWWLFLVVAIIILAITSEYKSQDNRYNKCANSTKKGKITDDPEDIIDKTITTMRKNHTLVSWRRSILVGLILAFPIVYLITKQVSNGYYYAATAFLISLFIYFSHIYTEHNWWFKRGQKVEDELLNLRNRLTSE